MLKRVLDALDSLDERMGIYRGKRIDFEIDGAPAALIREWWTGRLTLQVGDKEDDLQNRFTGILPFVTIQRWSRRIGDHDVVVEGRFKALFGALRPATYRVFVDGVSVKEANLQF